MNDLLKKYFGLLSKWNRKINLTVIDGEAEFFERDVRDAEIVLGHIGGAKTLIDLGTGAGIPGIILKIMRSGLDVTLIDSTRKKISFCGEAIRRLGLSGIRAEWGRAEDARIYKKLDRFDVVISRATWELKKFIEIATHYVKDDGRLIALKGLRWQEELEAAKKVLADSCLVLDGTHPYTLSGGQSRCLLSFIKNRGQT